MMSFIKYVPEESTQKAINALDPAIKTEGTKKFPKKMGGAKTLKFLSHCLGLAVRIIW